MRFGLLLSLTSLALVSSVHSLGSPGLVTETPHYGPEVTVEFLYKKDGPTGIAVSRKGRYFSNFPGAGAGYTLAELVNGTTEVPYPSLEFNTPPSKVNDTMPGFAANYANYLLAVQTVISESLPSLFGDLRVLTRANSVDAKDRIWAFDTGRPNGLLNGGGAKLVGWDLNSQSKEPFKTIILPSNVAYPETLLNDARIDLRPGITK
jgi:hypothetical protein